MDLSKNDIKTIVYRKIIMAYHFCEFSGHRREGGVNMKIQWTCDIHFHVHVLCFTLLLCKIFLIKRCDIHTRGNVTSSGYVIVF